MSFPDNPPPDPGFEQAQLSIRSIVSKSSNNFNLVQRRKVYSNKWIGSFTLPNMKQDTARGWKAWITGLIGKRGTFKVSDPNYFQPRGNVDTNNSNITVNSTTSDSSILILENLNANISNVFKAGDQFEVDNELKIVARNTDSDNNGSAQVIFFPRLHNENVKGNSVTVDNPSGEFRLRSNLNQWDDDDQISNLSFEVEEVV